MTLAGGSLAVTFWPSDVEDKGPWQRLADLTTNKPKAQAVSCQTVHSKVGAVMDHTILACYGGCSTFNHISHDLRMVLSCTLSFSICAECILV